MIPRLDVPPVYGRLGVEPVLNVAAAFTALGGQIMPEEVIHAMNEAAEASVDMHELHIAAGRRLALLTGNESAYVTSGCAAALVLAVLGIRTQGDPGVITEFPGHEAAPYEVIMHAAHRIPYDASLALAGATVRQIGNVLQTFQWELERAITPRTAAVLWVPGTHLPQAALPLATVVEIAHARGVPVIVDAAAQLPPVSNLWHFTSEVGADLAVFSGGKALRGPQASGLMVGRADLVEAARRSGSPYQWWARPMKAGKEEIAGLVAAVERYVRVDQDELRMRWMGVVERWREAVPSAVATRIDLLNEAGQPMPRLFVDLPGERGEAALRGFAASRPRLIVLPDRRNGRLEGFWLTPDLMRGDEPAVVARILAATLFEVVSTT